ncbi:helix-turn-helix transcriptional regulator [Catelliglobosispora koreensis]|uniref:helix-turn-helix transcriptional regulator n=1 Tax=Catelliglobosispora koreensis TaxID=129052 RepID=UPI00036D6286|nr:AAA family ATPase [Catelliglobosispora koreensis]
MTSSAAPRVLGREAELREISAIAAQAFAGEGAAIVLEGEPGIGKTTLLDTAAAECQRLGARVLRAAAEDLEQRLPFAAIGAALGVRTKTDDAGAAKVASLMRGEGALGQSLSAANHELAIVEAILDLLDQWSTEAPIALIVDDMQWADPSSALALNRIGQALSQQPLLLIVSGRSTPRSEAITGLVRGLRSRGAKTLTLGPLDRESLTSLAERLIGARPGPVLTGLMAGAGGNPMYVAELITALSTEDAIDITDGVADVAPPLAGRVPRSLIEVIIRRLDFLPHKARETLQMAAVLGPTVDLTELAAVTGNSVAVLSEIAITAVDSGLLIDTGTDLLFRHDLIREALAASLPGSVRIALNLHAGQVLGAIGAPVERIAEHMLAGTSIDRATIEWLTDNADQLITRSPRTAVTLLRRALDSAEDAVAEQLRFDLIRALLWVGDAHEAEHAVRTALVTGHHPHREGALYWLLLQSCYRQGRLVEAKEAAERALRSPELTQGEISRMHGFLSLCHTVMFQFDEAEAAALRSIAAGEASGDRIAIGYGYDMLAGVNMMGGEFSQALSYVDRALSAFGGAATDPDQHQDPYYLRGFCLTMLDRLAEADEALATSIRENVRVGGIYAGLSGLVRTRIRFSDGRWDDALAEVQTSLESFDPYHFGLPAQAIAAMIGLHRQSTAVGTQSIPADDDSAGMRSSRFLLLWAKAIAEETASGPQAALDILYPVWRDGGLMEHHRVIYDICPDLTRLAAAAGDSKCLRELAASTQQVAFELPNPTTKGIAQFCRGVAGGDPDLILSAAASFAEAKRPLFEGYALEHAALALVPLGRADEARKALDSALMLYGDLDAAWDTGRAEARLRQSGVRRGVRGRRGRPKKGWESLTETEHKVLALVVEGLSNPDIAAQMFLSRRTVQTHVSNILSKLDARSRVELAITAARRPDAGNTAGFGPRS